MEEDSRIDEWARPWIDKLIELYNKGVTYREIGNEIYLLSGKRRIFTRSAISGKVNRLIKKGVLERKTKYFLKGRLVTMDPSRLKPAKPADTSGEKRKYVTSKPIVRFKLSNLNKKKEIEEKSPEQEIDEVNKRSQSRAKAWNPTFVRSMQGKALPGLRYPTRPPTENSVTLVFLGYKRCRAPVGDEFGADQLFCNEPTEEGDSYCGNCKSFLYQKVTKEKESDMYRRFVPKGERQ